MEAGRESQYYIDGHGADDLQRAVMKSLARPRNSPLTSGNQAEADTVAVT